MSSRIARRLAVDVLAWHCIPAAFLFIYVQHHFMPADAIGPHLRIVWLLLLAFTLFRLTISMAGVSAAGARAVTALAASALLSLMLSYYLLVLIGLQSWGRVVSWDLITSYGTQFVTLADALGIPLVAAIGVPLLAAIGLLIAAWLYLGIFDWALPLRRAVSTPLFAFILAAGAAVWAIELYGFLAGPSTQQSEPVSLTLYPNEAAWDVQGHAVDTLKPAHLAAAEDAARRGYIPAASAERKNVILIVVDALRPDHMGIYGYERDTTPNLARLERLGMLRKAASMRASCSSSFCGLLSISTSRFLHQFSERAITLQEALKRHGYRVHMILSGNHALFYGLRKAYGEVDTYFDANDRRSANYANDDQLILERLSRFPSWDGQPAFIQFHLMSAHPLGSRDSAMARYAPAANYALFVNRDAQRGAEPSTRSINYYDNGVLQADAMIRRILDALEAKGYLKNTMVAITADHGEALGEHGFFQHANSVREEVLRIPFVLLSFGYGPSRPLDGHALRSQIDVAPTLLAELGMPQPASWQGAPLQESASREFLYFQEMWEAGLYDLRDARNFWKYWTNLKTGEEHAFNLTLDPRERSNAIEKASPEQKRAWRAQLLAKGPLRFKGRPEQDLVK